MGTAKFWGRGERYSIWITTRRCMQEFYVNFKDGFCWCSQPQTAEV